MRSSICNFFIDLQKIATKENIIIQAQHFDFFEYYFNTPNYHMFLQNCLEDYKKFLLRWNTLTNNGKNTEPTPNEKGQTILSPLEADKLLNPDKHRPFTGNPNSWDNETHY